MSPADLGALLFVALPRGGGNLASRALVRAALLALLDEMHAPHEETPEDRLRELAEDATLRDYLQGGNPG